MRACKHTDEYITGQGKEKEREGENKLGLTPSWRPWEMWLLRSHGLRGNRKVQPVSAHQEQEREHWFPGIRLARAWDRPGAVSK